MRAAPATDGRGSQDQYADAVDRWCDFHNLLQEKNPNGIQPKLSGTILWAQLSSLAKNCARKIPRSILMYEKGAKSVFAAFN